MPKSKDKKKFSWGTILFGLTLLICSLGLLFVFESSVAESFNTFGHPYHYVKSQGMWFGIGLVALLVASFLPIKLLKKIAPLLFGLALIGLILVFIPGVGLKLNGARRWFHLPGLPTIQPVEFTKLSIVLFFASWMSRHQRLMPFLFLTGLPTVLILLQPDLGSLLVVGSIALGLFFVAGGNIKSILGLGLASLILILIMIFSSSYRMRRVATFFNPELDPLGSGFHVHQITLALGRGGWLGKGLGESKQKYAYIPEASSDSILAIVAEEIGFIGMIVIIGLYLTYFFVTYKITTLYSAGSFEYLLGTGILIWIAAQTLLNIAAVVALVPLTGMPLPFFSYGGSSLVMVMLSSGILIKLARKKQLT